MKFFPRVSRGSRKSSRTLNSTKAVAAPSSSSPSEIRVEVAVAEAKESLFSDVLVDEESRSETLSNTDRTKDSLERGRDAGSHTSSSSTKEPQAVTSDLQDLTPSNERDDVESAASVVTECAREDVMSVFSIRTECRQEEVKTTNWESETIKPTDVKAKTDDEAERPLRVDTSCDVFRGFKETIVESVTEGRRKSLVTARECSEKIADGVRQGRQKSAALAYEYSEGLAKGLSEGGKKSLATASECSGELAQELRRGGQQSIETARLHSRGIAKGVRHSVDRLVCGDEQALLYHAQRQEQEQAISHEGNVLKEEKLIGDIPNVTDQHLRKYTLKRLVCGTYHCSECVSDFAVGAKDIICLGACNDDKTYEDIDLLSVDTELHSPTTGWGNDRAEMISPYTSVGTLLSPAAIGEAPSAFTFDSVEGDIAYFTERSILVENSAPLQESVELTVSEFNDAIESDKFECSTPKTPTVKNSKIISVESLAKELSSERNTTKNLTRDSKLSFFIHRLGCSQTQKGNPVATLVPSTVPELSCNNNQSYAIEECEDTAIELLIDDSKTKRSAKSLRNFFRKEKETSRREVKTLVEAKGSSVSSDTQTPSGDVRHSTSSSGSTNEDSIYEGEEVIMMVKTDISRHSSGSDKSNRMKVALKSYGRPVKKRRDASMAAEVVKSVKATDRYQC